MNFGPRRQQQESDSFAQLQSLTKGPKVQSPKKLPLRRQAVRLFKSFDERGGEVDKETRMLPDQISEEDSQLCDDQKELQPLNSNSCNAKDDKLIENVKKQLRFVAKDRNRRTMRNDNFNKETYGVPKHCTIIRETGTLCQLNAIAQSKDQLLRGFFNQISM